MTEVVTSMSADALVAKARECFELGLIDQPRLEKVTRRAYSEPGYNAILDLPLGHEIQAEKDLRALAASAQRAQVRRLIKIPPFLPVAALAVLLTTTLGWWVGLWFLLGACSTWAPRLFRRSK